MSPAFPRLRGKVARRAGRGSWLRRRACEDDHQVRHIRHFAGGPPSGAARHLPPQTGEGMTFGSRAHMRLPYPKTGEGVLVYPFAARSMARRYMVIAASGVL